MSSYAVISCTDAASATSIVPPTTLTSLASLSSSPVIDDSSDATAPAVSVTVKSMSADWDVVTASMEFSSMFNAAPSDALTSSVTLIWSAPKRPSLLERTALDESVTVKLILAVSPLTVSSRSLPSRLLNWTPVSASTLASVTNTWSTPLSTTASWPVVLSIADALSVIS